MKAVPCFKLQISIYRRPTFCVPVFDFLTAYAEFFFYKHCILEYRVIPKSLTLEYQPRWIFCKIYYISDLRGISKPASLDFLSVKTPIGLFPQSLSCTKFIFVKTPIGLSTGRIEIPSDWTF